MYTRHLSNDQICSVSYYQTMDSIGDTWREILKENLHLRPGAKVLDVGCGNGIMAILLAQLGYDVTALDHSQAILQDAVSNAESYGLQDKIRFIQADAAATGLPAESFDGVISRNATSLFLKPFEAYEEWSRLLKKDGQMLNFDANWLSPLWGEEHTESFCQDEKLVRQEIPEYTDIYHDRYALFQLSQYPLSYIQRPDWDEGVCENLGFQDISVREYPSRGILPPVLARRFRSIPMFLIKARKP